jgi:hypothetical protein
MTDVINIHVAKAAQILGDDMTAFVTGGRPLDQASPAAIDALLFLARAAEYSPTVCAAREGR